MIAGIAIGFSVGLLVGVAGGATLIRHGMKLHERISWGVREGRPVFSEYDPPLEQEHTGYDAGTGEEP